MSEVAQAEEWNISELGLKIQDPDLTLARFADLCWQLGRFHEAVRFAIGDAIIQGEHLFGEACYQAVEEMQLSEDARQEYVRVAQRVPPSRRRKGLSWSHHRAVAGLTKRLPSGEKVPDAEAQELWLAIAKDRGLSHHALREELRNGAEPQASTTCRCCGRPLAGSE